MAEKSSSIRKRSRMSHLPPETPDPAESAGSSAEELLGRHEEDDHRLEHLHQVLRHVLGEDVDEKPAAEEGAEEKGGGEHPRRVVAPEEGNGDAREAVAGREAV